MTTAPDADQGDPAATSIADPAASGDATSGDAPTGQPTGPVGRAATSDLAWTGADLSVGATGLVLLGAGTAAFLIGRNRRPHTRHRRWGLSSNPRLPRNAWHPLPPSRAES
ncbi:hypothetical protein [Kitasatospora sp. NPDC090308]|uniref:hypothetical protein n=1 Tax=Kitasatospora sp. NPDC090308 TaxID=3364082 RepID=UPI00380448B1